MHTRSRFRYASAFPHISSYFLTISSGLARGGSGVVKVSASLRLDEGGSSSSLKKVGSGPSWGDEKMQNPCLSISAFPPNFPPPAPPSPSASNPPSVPPPAPPSQPLSQVPPPVVTSSSSGPSSASSSVPPSPKAEIRSPLPTRNRPIDMLVPPSPESPALCKLCSLAFLSCCYYEFVVVASVLAWPLELSLCSC